MDKADIQAAALYRFAEQGFLGTSMKQLADDLGVTAGAIYYHFKNKDDLLATLIEEIIVADLDLARRIKQQGGIGSLDQMIYALVYGVCRGREEAIIIEREANHLQKRFQERVARVIHEVEREYAECVAEEYDLSGTELTIATKAILGMGTSVLQWFHSDGLLSAHEVAYRYIRCARGLLERAEQDAADGRWAPPRRGKAPGEFDSPSFEHIVTVIDETVAARRSEPRPVGVGGRTVGLRSPASPNGSGPAPAPGRRPPPVR